MKEKKRLIIILLAAALLLAGGFFGWRQFDRSFLIVDGQIVPRDAIALDLSGSSLPQPKRLEALTELRELNLTGTGMTGEEFDALQEALPNCDIQWEVPFQGGLYNSHAPQNLSAQSLTYEDVKNLSYLRDLRSFDAQGCHDYPQIMALMAQHPECDISYRVIIGTQEIPGDSLSLTVSDTPPETVGQTLMYLPKVSSVTFLQEGLDFDALATLVLEYPQVSFEFPMELYGIPFHFTDAELDFTDIPMDSTAKIDAIAGLMPNLQKINMTRCGISNEDMDALCQKYPDIKFVWEVSIGQFITLSTDATCFMPHKLGYTVRDSDLENLKYCTDIICLDLGHMPISDCSFLACMPHMRYLILADTGISDISALEGLKELVFLELFMSKVKDYTPLLGCTALEDLNISYTQGDPTVIGQMTWLKRLWWTGGGITNEQLDALLAALPDTLVKRPSVSSTGGGWRQGDHYYAMRDLLGMPYNQ